MTNNISSSPCSVIMHHHRDNVIENGCTTASITTAVERQRQYAEYASYAGISSRDAEKKEENYGDVSYGCYEYCDDVAFEYYDEESNLPVITV